MDTNDTALARVVIAAEAGDVEAKPEHVIDWEKFVKAPGKPNAADVSEFRKRQGLAPIKYADDADDEPEMPADGNGVVSEAEAAHLEAAQGE